MEAHLQPRSDDIFRKEALDHKSRSSDLSPILMLPVRPSTWLYWLLAALAAALSVVLVTVRVASDISAPAMIRATRHDGVRTPKAGIVERVFVNAGDRVKASDPVIALETRETRAELLSNEAELRATAASMLLRPRDYVSQQALMRLRVAHDELQRSLESAILRAPRDGVLTDLRIRTGQSVSPGETLASISVSDSPFEVLAFVPGGMRPDVTVGQVMVLIVGSTERTYRELTVSRVDDRAIGPADLQRVLGREVGDAVSVSGPVFVVRATLRQDGDAVTNDVYFDGMPATATIKTSPKRALFVVFPSLGALFGTAP